MIDLKEVRESKGMTQQELADEVGVIRQAISNIECGIAKPSIPTAQKIGKALDFTWSKFFEE